MRQTVLIATLMACIALAQAAAQAAPPSHNILTDPNRFADAHVNGLDAQVHLSEQQKAKLHPLFVAECRKLIAIMNDSSLGEEQRQQAIQQLHEQTQDMAMSMLTPTQRQQFNHAPRPAPSQQPAPNRT
jgi:Spy/CpxP family protein refolding chaperone